MRNPGSFLARCEAGPAHFRRSGECVDRFCPREQQRLLFSRFRIENALVTEVIGKLGDDLCKPPRIVTALLELLDDALPARWAIDRKVRNGCRQQPHGMHAGVHFVLEDVVDVAAARCHLPLSVGNPGVILEIELCQPINLFKVRIEKLCDETAVRIVQCAALLRQRPNTRETILFARKLNENPGGLGADLDKME